MASKCMNVGNPVKVNKAIYHLDEFLCLALQESMESSCCFCRQRLFFKNKVKNVCNFLQIRSYVVFCKEYFSIIATGKHRLLECRCLNCFKSTNLLPYMFKSVTSVWFFFSLKKFKMQGGK